MPGPAALSVADARVREGADATLAFAVKGDARFTRTSSSKAKEGGMEAADADVWLLRSGIEGSRRFALGAGDGAAALTPSFELGLRLDGGDAETGLGADMGGGLALADPKHGLSFDLKARGLVAHRSSGFREWGASAAFGFDPRPSTDRGLSLSLTQSWGASPAGGMDALLSRETLAGLAANDNGGATGRFEAASRLQGELGYGIAAFGGGFTGTPNVGFGLSGKANARRATARGRRDRNGREQASAARRRPKLRRRDWRSRGRLSARPMGSAAREGDGRGQDVPSGRRTQISARLGSARLGSARLGSARLGSARLLIITPDMLSGRAKRPPGTRFSSLETMPRKLPPARCSSSPMSVTPLAETPRPTRRHRPRPSQGNRHRRPSCNETECLSLCQQRRFWP